MLTDTHDLCAQNLSKAQERNSYCNIARFLCVSAPIRSTSGATSIMKLMTIFAGNICCKCNRLFVEATSSNFIPISCAIDFKYSNLILCAPSGKTVHCVLVEKMRLVGLLQ